MSWIVLAIIPQLLWSLSNIIDEYLSTHHIKDAVLLIIMASLLQIVPGFILVVTQEGAMNIGLLPILILSALGAFIMMNFIPYIKAIQIDGAGVAVPLYQMIPIYTFLFAWVFLAETIDGLMIAAAAMIILASVGMTWDFSKKTISFQTFYLMTVSCIGWGIYNVTNRYYLADLDWLIVMGWMWLGSGLWAFTILTLNKNRRLALQDVFLKQKNFKASSLLIAQAVLDVLGFALFIRAIQLAPAAGLVPTIGGTQAFFIFIIAGVLGYFFPKVIKPIGTKSMLFWRLFCVLMLFTGLAILSLSTT